MLDQSSNNGVSSVTPEVEEMLSSQEQTCFGAVSKTNQRKVNGKDTSTNVRYNLDF